MGIVTDLWRHPIKGVGREQLNTVSLAVGKTMPWDRHWALAHADAKVDLDNPEWARCMNFARAARGHKLMAATSQLDETTGVITLSHPDLATISVNPDDTSDAKQLIDWVTEISNLDRSLPAQVFKAPDRGMTDSNTPTISINTKASLDAQGLTTGFSFLDRSTGWDFSFSVLPYEISDTYSRVVLIGILNTLLLGFLGISLATIFGIIIGLVRTSKNYLFSFLGTVYVETFRNIPLILQAIF